jgi:hypothetical protein
MAALPKTISKNVGRLDAGVALTGARSNTGRGANRRRSVVATDNLTAECRACSPMSLMPAGRVVAVGRHNFLPIAAVAWISDRNEIVAAVVGNSAEVGHSVLIRVWTKDSRIICRASVFEAQGDRAVATAVLGAWDGLPVTGLTLLSVIAEGEEQ